MGSGKTLGIFCAEGGTIEKRGCFPLYLSFQFVFLRFNRQLNTSVFLVSVFQLPSFCLCRKNVFVCHQVASIDPHSVFQRRQGRGRVIGPELTGTRPSRRPGVIFIEILVFAPLRQF